jgi:hypothetical protein
MSAPCRMEWGETMIGAPAEEDSQVGFGVQPGLAAVATEIRGHRRTQDELISRYDVGTRGGKGSLTPPSVAGLDERQSARSGRCAHLTLVGVTLHVPVTPPVPHA